MTCSLTLFGMNYRQFKQNVLKHSKILQSNRLTLDAAQKESDILMLADNPTLELETSRFNPDIGGSRFGYRASYSQPIRTGGYYSALTQKAQARKLLQRAYAAQGKAGFLRELEHLYTAYIYQSKRTLQLKQEHTISQKLASIAKERFKHGAESRAQYIQAKTDAMMVKTEILAAKRKSRVIYYQMLGLAGLGKNVSLSKRFIYTVSSKVPSYPSHSPNAKILEAKERAFSSEASLNDHAFQNFSVVGEFESEPEQNIGRIGLSIPLPIFNDNSEKKMLAKIKQHQARLDREQLQQNEAMQRASLRESIRELSAQYHALKTLEKEQKELMKLFEEGYRISKGSLLDLLITKRKWVNTQQSLIQTQRLINDQKIELNYLEGRYND